MLSTRQVASGMQAAQELAQQLIADLDAELWNTDEPDATTADLRDYLIGAARAVESNLLTASVHMKNYREARYAQDNAMRIRMTTTGRPFPAVGIDPRHEEREAELTAAEQGIYVSVGAVMDCLAAVVAGIAGLGCDVHRVDFGILLPVGDFDGYPETSSRAELRKSLAAPGSDLLLIQITALRGLHGAIRAAGPEGWLIWMLGMRNMIVHRERRTQFIVIDRPVTRGGVVISRVPPADPGKSNMQGLRSSQKDLGDFYISEDILQTLEGALASLNAAVVGTIAVIGRLWLERRQRPDLRVPTSKQWKQAVSPQTFKGYAPGSVKLRVKENALVMNPQDIARLRAGKLLTET